jgi:hypothetical protein
VWLVGVKNEEEAKRQKEFEELQRATEWRIKTLGSHSDTITTIQADFEKERKAMTDRMKGRGASRAKEEWDARLQREDLKMEQWTDITLQENAAVAAVMWGVSEYEDSIVAESFGEAETDTSSSVTATPSMSSRGPQLWTPPYVSGVTELPAPSVNIARAPLDAQRNNDAKTLPSRRGPISSQTSAGRVATTAAKTVAEEWLAQNRSSERFSKPAKLPTYSRVAPNNAKSGPYKRTSWADDEATLLAPSHDVTDNEFYHDTDVSSS